MRLTPVKSEQTRFANKYDYNHALQYFHRYCNDGPKRRMTNWLEQKMAKRALIAAGLPTNILDIPCGTGRFWATLKHSSAVKLYVSDFNIAMLEVGLEKRASELTANLGTSISSVFNLPFSDNTFDSIFCMRFIHHINHPDDRLQLLKELARVTADTVCISAWVEKTGLKGKIRFKKEALRNPDKEYNKFVHLHDVLLAEFSAAGLELVTYTDLLPNLSLWRTYVLRKKCDKKAVKPDIVSYVCPLCKGPLSKDENASQLVCNKEQLAYPMKGQLPLLTQRDSIKLTAKHTQNDRILG